jgi:hypothetical protein
LSGLNDDWLLLLLNGCGELVLSVVVGIAVVVLLVFQDGGLVVVFRVTAEDDESCCWLGDRLNCLVVVCVDVAIYK